MPDKLRIAMLISGGGTTMQAIMQACKKGKLVDKVEPVLVIASRPDAGGITKAITEGLAPRDVVTICRNSYPDKLAFGEAILDVCRERSVDFIGQYGWMVQTPSNVIQTYPGMMTNQHPALIDPGRPDFGGKGMYGMRVHCAVLHFARSINRPFTTGAVAQRVAIKYDRGAVLRSQAVLIKKTDDPYDLQRRVLPVEHQVQIDTLLDFANGTVTEEVRENALILPEEIVLLEQSKEIAATLFPKG